MRIKINHNDEDLWCIYSKERIEVGEKYAILEEETYDGESIEKVYKLDCVPTDDEENLDIYIGE